MSIDIARVEGVEELVREEVITDCACYSSIDEKAGERKKGKRIDE